jgi:hypothetical protein
LPGTALALADGMKSIAIVVVSITLFAGVARADDTLVDHEAVGDAAATRNIGIVFMAAGGALAISGGALGVVSAFDRLACVFCSTSPELQSQQSLALGLALGGIAATVAVGVPLLVTGQARLNKLRRHDLKLAVGANGVALSGRF